MPAGLRGEYAKRRRSERRGSREKSQEKGGVGLGVVEDVEERRHMEEVGETAHGRGRKDGTWKRSER